MKWVSALSKQPDIDAAVQEASEEIIRQLGNAQADLTVIFVACLLSTSPRPRDLSTSRMPSAA